MHRRQLLIGLGSALAATKAPAWAQPPSKPRVVWFSSASEVGGIAVLEALLEGMHKLGYQQDRDFALETRWGDYSAERTKALAAKIELSHSLNTRRRGPASS